MAIMKSMKKESNMITLLKIVGGCCFLAACCLEMPKQMASIKSIINEMAKVKKS